MLLKPPSKIRPSLGISQSRMRSKTPCQQRPSSQTPTIRKKFTPRVNKSFTCYTDQKIPKHSRTSSLDKAREVNASIKHSKTRSLKSSGKILAPSKEILSLDSAKIEMNYGNYLKALDLLNKSLKIDATSLEGIYSRGVCYMHLTKFELAIKDFIKVLEIDPIFDRQLYIALYMCCSSLNQQTAAIQYLSKGLKKFPSFTQGFLLRGQVYNKLKKYDKALQDFKKVLNQDKQQYSTLLLIAESYIGLKDYISAIKVLNLSISRPEISKNAFLLRIQVFYELHKYEEALLDIEMILKDSIQEEKAFYYKGRIKFDNKQYSDAALCFEQAIQLSNDREIMNFSLYYLGIMKINERDFYGALHTIERGLIASQIPELKALHNYTEGVISLMKRKLDEGIIIFSQILKENDKILKEYTINTYENRGFAYFSLNKYELALEDFLEAKKNGLIEKASEFNIILCEAILSSFKGDDVNALKLFKNSKELFPKNIMPDLCRACIIMQISLNSSENLHLLSKSESLIEKIVKSREPECEVMFYRSIIRFCLKNYEAALESAKRAIEKADENISIHYVQRAFCYIALKKYEEAVQDFTIAIQLNENIKEIYIYRGISAFLQDDLHLALEDFLTVSKKSPEDQQLQRKMSKLLMIIGSFTESLEVIQGITKIDEEKIHLEAENYMLLNDHNKALKCIKSILKNKDIKNERKARFEVDKSIFELFIEIKNNPETIFEATSLCDNLKKTEGIIFTKKYLY